MKSQVSAIIMMLLFSFFLASGCQDTASAPSSAAPPQTAAADEKLEPQAAATESPVSLAKDDLLNRQFTLTKINGANFSGERTPILEISEDITITGRICNNFLGQGELTGNMLMVKAVAATRMICPDAKLGELESRFFQMLEAGATITVDGTIMMLSQGDSILTFENK